MYSLWPPLKGGYGEEGHHGCQNIVKVKLAVLPASRLDNGVVNLSIFVCDIVTPEKERERGNHGVSRFSITHDSWHARWDATKLSQASEESVHRMDKVTCQVTQKRVR